MKLELEKLPIEEQVIAGRLILEDADESKREETLGHFDQDKQLRILLAVADFYGSLSLVRSIAQTVGKYLKMEYVNIVVKTPLFSFFHSIKNYGAQKGKL